MVLPIGTKMRELRQRKNWTLAQLAKHSGVALSSLSRIETGRMTGTLESHIQVAKSLGVRLAELYAEVDPAGARVEHHHGQAVSQQRRVTSKGWIATLLTTGSLRKKMLPSLIDLPAGKETSAAHDAPGTERFFYLLKGRLDVAVGKERFSLHPDDSLYFQGSLPHSIRNAGDAAALLLSVSSPPSV